MFHSSYAAYAGKIYGAATLAAALALSGCGGGDDLPVVTAPSTDPVVHIVSPASGASVARGEGLPGAGSFNGSGFALNLEVITRDTVGVAAQESLNIRDTTLLGSPNPKFPGLTVTFDTDLIKPDGGIIAKGTNLAALFNVTGSDDTPGAGITLWTGWHVLESLPLNVSKVSITASVRDVSGRVATDTATYNILPGSASGQGLTPQVAGLAGDGIDDADGPQVTLLAPRLPSSVSTGPLSIPTPPSNASLFFIQVSALDKTGAGIAVNENGEGKAAADRGTILDGSQIAVNGPNRNFPGLVLTFDVPLRQPNGNVIPAGQNMAPIFNIAGSERAADGVRVTADWVVGGSLMMPAGKTAVKVTARVTDNAGKTGSSAGSFEISPVVNGQDLTPSP